MTDLTLMAVHAHPDDESISTGGTLARYSAEGVRTVLVTCTDGGCGDGQEGSKPGDPLHDREAVVAQRRRELERSCQALGIAHLETLGYRDSGMMGWPDNDAPGSFWTTPVEEAAAVLAELFRRYQPDVVVTYDPNGFYGHPDHIQAHRITMAAAEVTGIPEKLYYTAVPRSAMAEFGRRLEQLGLSFGDDSDQADQGDASQAGGAEPTARPAGRTEAGARDTTSDQVTASRTSDPSTGPEPEPEPVGPREEWGTPDEQVTSFLDVSGYTDRKFESIQCHASQADNIFFLKLDRSVFSELLGVETFVRVKDRTGAPLPESDLFAGLRSGDSDS